MLISVQGERLFSVPLQFNNFVGTIKGDWDTILENVVKCQLLI